MTACDVDRALNNALALATEKLLCFPCKLSKRPACRHGFHDASNDPEMLRELWKQFPGELVGVRTGETSGIDALDIDAKHQEALDWSAAHHQRIPSTRVHKTRSGGAHLLFRHASGFRCSAGRLARGVDIRADGGYIIWWPAAGFRVLRTGPITEWPQWLLDELISPQRASQAAQIRVPDNFILAQLVRMVATAPEGQRNSLTFWAACRAGEMVASGLLDAETAAAMIAEAAIHAGLERPEADRTARSGVETTGGAALA